jgi:hypothetical protein
MGTRAGRAGRTSGTRKESGHVLLNGGEEEVGDPSVRKKGSHISLHASCHHERAH